MKILTYFLAITAIIGGGLVLIPYDRATFILAVAIFLTTLD